MARPAALVFDVDDTLYDLALPFYRACERILADRWRRLPAERLFTRFRARSDEALELLSRGDITPQDHAMYRLQRAFADFGVFLSSSDALELQAAYQLEQREICMYPEACDMLALISQAGLPVGIISNGEASHQLEKLRLLGVGRWVADEHVVISGELGENKPAPGPFQKMESLLGVSGEGVWYVGDTFETDVVGAKRAGWSCLWVNRRARTAPAVPEQPDGVVVTPSEMRDFVVALLRYR